MTEWTLAHEDRRAPLLGRRTVMAVGMGAAALAALPSSASAAAKRLDPKNADDARKIIRKLRYRTDEGMVFWWIKGEYLADVDATLTPLYGMNFGGIQMVRQGQDGGFDVTQMELGFRTDLATGKRLGDFRNPLTGEMLVSPFNPIGPTTIHYSPDAIPTVPRNLGGSDIEFQPFPETPFEAQGNVFVQYRARSRVRTAGFADRIVNDVSMIYGPSAQALDPRTTSVDAWVHSSDVTSFPRWLKMGDRPGTITLRGIGAKVLKIGDMPQDWLAMLEAHDRTIIADPEAALRRPPVTYKG
ncbi:DUF1838 family protein [Sphingomonas sp. 4RDLI-65]|uniref:DUF1838 family protein n=1 Tax=Sphingomonas sp. 4RDLI-65 TaxID=3111641 RepID=UPI003C13A24A